MTHKHLIPLLFALAPALLAQDAPAEPQPAETPATHTDTSITAPEQPAPSYSCDDTELEAKLAEIKQKAEAGDAEAAKQLYTAYALAGHTPQGQAWSDRYVALIEEKAEAGDADAMYQLGLMYLAGKDYVFPDPGKAVKWLHRAMEHGVSDAAYLVGEILSRQGDKAGSTEAFTKAYTAFSAKAQEGDATSLVRVGLMLLNGQGVAQDQAAGVAKLEEAAGKGAVPAMEQLFRIYAKGAGVPEDMARALHFAKMAADQDGDGLMCYAVACMYLRGQGTAVDEAEGDKYLDKAAAANIPAAILYKAARLQAAGKEEQAFAYYNQGASMGMVPCITEVGRTLLHGLAGQERDTERALALLTKASDSWDLGMSEIERSASAIAAYELARYYAENGEDALAETWYIIASNHGHPAAFAKRGLLHLNPFSAVTWDPTTAYRWWITGRDAGDSTCKLYLNLFYYLFMPLLVVLAFGLPAMLVHRLNRRKQAAGMLEPKI